MICPTCGQHSSAEAEIARLNKEFLRTLKALKLCMEDADKQSFDDTIDEAIKRVAKDVR